jgi:hypothetical protein
MRHKASTLVNPDPICTLTPKNAALFEVPKSFLVLFFKKELLPS